MSESTTSSAAFDGIERDIKDSAIYVTVDEALYPLEALYAAAFTFLDRAYVLLSRSDVGFRAALRPKPKGKAAKGKTSAASASESSVSAEELDALAGDFAAELLACAYRERLTAANRPTLEAITAQAIGGALGPGPSLDDLEDFDFTEEPFEDPLGIAMSWEDKYGKKDKTS